VSGKNCDKFPDLTQFRVDQLMGQCGCHGYRTPVSAGDCTRPRQPARVRTRGRGRGRRGPRAHRMRRISDAWSESWWLVSLLRVAGSAHTVRAPRRSDVCLSGSRSGKISIQFESPKLPLDRTHRRDARPARAKSACCTCGDPSDNIDERQPRHGAHQGHNACIVCVWPSTALAAPATPAAAHPREPSGRPVGGQWRRGMRPRAHNNHYTIQHSHGCRCTPEPPGRMCGAPKRAVSEGVAGRGKLLRLILAR
jgi:hypothetical protein